MTIRARLTALTAGAAALALLMGCAGGTGSRVLGEPSSWFGVIPPRGLAPAKTAPATPPLRAARPVDDPVSPDLDGQNIRPAVETIVGFADRMHAAGHQMWGRISGFPSERETAVWLAGEFKKAGLEKVDVQTYTANGDFWWPQSWEVRVLADPHDGPASRDVVLQSAIPVSRSQISGEIKAPLIVVGEAGAASLAGVAGKIAVQHTRPLSGAYADRAKVRDSAAALMKAGAVAVFNWVEQDGNMHVFDFGGCGGPCFNLGGDDGRFLVAAIAKARAAGAPDLEARLRLEAETSGDRQAANVLGVVRGASPDVIVINAHLDSWFSGAGDNADGAAVLLALAKYYGRPEHKPARTLVFVGSGGHHSPGLNGPAHLILENADLLKPTVLVVNLEHVAQIEINAAPTWSASPREEPKNVGISNLSPYLVATVKAAAQRYGFAIKPDITADVPGDLGGYAPLHAARIQAIHSGPLYHTSGDVPGSISTPGLERAARFYRYVIDQASLASTSAINP